MNSTSDHASESSLPIHTIQILPSSPPVLTPVSNSAYMEKGPSLKPEPPQGQDAQGSRPPLRRTASDETARPPSAQQSQHNADDQNSSNGEEESEEDDSDPADRIADFDWEELHHRYHDAMNGCHGEEEELMQEWQNLMAYFRIWAQAGHECETDRTFSRLQTRTLYVQHEEDTLEQKRKHYTDVVKAFENVIYLAHYPPEPIKLLRNPLTNDARPQASQPARSSSVPTCTSSRLHIMRCSVM